MKFVRPSTIASLAVALLFITAAFASLPQGAHADTPSANQAVQQQDGIEAGSGCGGTDCQACNLVGLIQAVINYAIGLSIPIAMGLFAWAGVLYFTSATNPHNIEHAKGIFRSALIGFVVALGAYLIIDTILHAILSPTQFSDGSWFTIKCVNDVQRQTNGQISDLLESALGNPPPPVTIDTSNSFVAIGCPSGSHSDATQQACVSDTTGMTLPGTAVISDPTFAANVQTACTTYGNCTLAQSIGQIESSGGLDCKTSATGAVGCMQVLATTACDIDSSINGCNACVNSHNSISAACQPVAQAISDPTLNTQLGVQYISQLSKEFNGSCELTAAAYYQGAGNVQKDHGVPAAATTYVAKACGN